MLGLLSRNTTAIMESPGLLALLLPSLMRLDSCMAWRLLARPMAITLLTALQQRSSVSVQMAHLTPAQCSMGPRGKQLVPWDTAGALPTPFQQKANHP